tara:strand:- start:1552 stop:1662 length:111 start_codon:yes stop_codon:yes gene_type:complete
MTVMDFAIYPFPYLILSFLFSTESLGMKREKGATTG